ncbi:biotin transporter BioY [Ktedonosporobacter rubrisoli]|uniref:Biotin transporter n=1 Tax=Ktedonosporobacter rubrisoli TaxID=2509675 RepID=A0A4P6JVE7_KTERU|nr:biotin transporter BioY [Ktedonosporobacter rubrisoli]QBD79639.1 biotin transporter BioY [Ktedonosporobacter rubrisoli]
MAISPGSTLIDHVIPARASRSANLLQDALLVIGGSLLVAASAQISIQLPFTPVPITGETLAVLLVGAALGSKRGALAMLMYLGYGFLNLPIFAGGKGGFAYMTGATGGYLLGFVVAAFVVGWLCERGLEQSFLTSVLAMLPGSVIIYALGAGWLMFLFHLNLAQAFLQGILPFIVGDVLKLVIAVALLPTAWSIMRRVRAER